MNIMYDVKARIANVNEWVLYSRSRDLAIANSLMDEALDLTRYDAVQIEEVKTTFVCRKEK